MVALVFGRLNRIAEPLFYGYELAPHHSEVAAWLKCGLLQHAGSADEIPGPTGEMLAVTHTSVGWIGADEDTGETHALSEDAVAVYRVSVSALIDLIRARSVIAGTGHSRSGNLHALGDVELPDGVGGRAYLSFPTPTEDALLTACAAMADAAMPVGVVTLVPLARSPDVQRKLDGWRITVGHVDADFRVCFPASAAGPSAAKAPEYGFLCEGATWRIHFLGEDFTVFDSRGMVMLAHLLHDTSESWTAFELQRGSRTSATHSADRDSGLETRDVANVDIATADGMAIVAYRREEQRLLREIETADADGRDLEKREAEDELEKFRRSKASIVGIGGRARRSGDPEKARKNVRKLINTALTEIASRNERVANYLRGRLHLESPLSYTPDRDEAWTVRFPRKE